MGKGSRNKRSRSSKPRKEVPQENVSVRAYLEEYRGEDRYLNVRLREKLTGRKVELGADKTHLLRFLSETKKLAARFGTTNFFERSGFSDFVLVCGSATVDNYDSIRFGTGPLTYIMGPTPQSEMYEISGKTVEEPHYLRHAKAAARHLTQGEYRATVLSARLSVEEVCGGGGGDSVRKAGDAAKLSHPADSSLLEAFALSKSIRTLAVHDSDKMVQQKDAELVCDSMYRIIEHIVAKKEKETAGATT